MSSKLFLFIALPLSINLALAKSQVIPQAHLDLALINGNKAQYIYKNAKGTIQHNSFTALSNPLNWFNLSPSDGIEGLGTDAVYRQFQEPNSEDIIVAVIDSGVDVNHEDLQGKIWINENEIPNNGVDDDNNGYTDDVFGWNFIGGRQGMGVAKRDESIPNGFRFIKGDPAFQVDIDTMELTRELARMNKLRQELAERGKELSSEQAEYLNLLQIRHEKESGAIRKVIQGYEAFKMRYDNNVTILKRAGLEHISIESVRSFASNERHVLEAKRDLLELLSNHMDEARINRILTQYRLEYRWWNVDFNPRLIVDDDESNPYEKNYGNNDVIGPDSSHGTHVAGIIAANRVNNIGTQGVASKVKIMAIRVVPNGDERDKDVANGIRYAVDNGARIINMSFGKAYSPYPGLVNEAIRYAESKNVLMVHAAGNSSQNNDTASSFPNRQDEERHREFTNWLSIGASSSKKGVNLPAYFSNYGEHSVDLFAPGLAIKSTTPDNHYDTYSGTSMAAPAAAGVAALILSYDEKLGTSELKDLMLNTSRLYPELEVNLPGTTNLVPFSLLSIKGSILDAFRAIEALQSL